MISLKYELLIRRAHQVDRFGHHAADAAKLNSLAEVFFRLNDDPTNKKLSRSYNKLFTEMKANLIEAFSTSLTRVAGNQIAESEINDCILDCQVSTDYRDLLAVIEKGAATFDSP